tara:strand:- start:14685 stop:15464 length:780 start_codon:yes stop_codon:yes gene_type:complete
MAEVWDTLKKELAFYGIRLIDSKTCQFKNKDGQLETAPVIPAAKQIQGQIAIRKKLFGELWGDMADVLQDRGDNVSDAGSTAMFVCALKDLAKMSRMFEDLDDSVLTNLVQDALNQDLSVYPNYTIHSVPNYKISIDWVFRSICRLQYVIKLLRFASLGPRLIDRMNIKMARGISGPWANLDLPLLERTFPWSSIDEEVRGRDRDIRRQRRYRRGLENYNNDGRIGEGHYWRELRNEPFSWYDRASESPYAERKLLTGN